MSVNHVEAPEVFLNGDKRILFEYSSDGFPVILANTNTFYKKKFLIKNQTVHTKTLIQLDICLSWDIAVDLFLIAKPGQ